jgi:sulfite exporter TauE/SafE
VAVPVADLLPDTIGPYLTLMVVGFFVGVFGHIVRSRLIVAVGIMMIFIATLLLPLAVIATEEEPETPGQEIYAPGTR